MSGRAASPKSGSTDVRSFTFHVAPFDADSFDVERHRVVAKSRILGIHVAAGDAADVTGPVIVPRRNGAADVTYSLEE